MKKYGILILVGCFLGLIAGCKPEPAAYVENPNMQNLTENQRYLIAKIERCGIHVMKQGMLFTFTIPTDRFFTHDTHGLRRGRAKALYVLAQFLESYRQYFAHPQVAVAGFTDKVWLYPERKLLSMHYAQTVASYLSQGGVPSDLMRVGGYGSKMAIASNEYPNGTMYNRRVVVIVR